MLSPSLSTRDLEGITHIEKGICSAILNFIFLQQYELNRTDFTQAKLPRNPSVFGDKKLV